MFAFAASGESPPDAERITAEQALDQSRAGGRLLIDVRSRQEWRATGIPKGSRAVTIHDPEGLEGFMKQVLKAVGGDRSKPIALICARGGRSARAQRYLRKHGFANVADVSEGMLGRGDRKGWLARGLPTQTCPVC
ncbi:MAG: rhodanese-like domain-containing protein [Pseudomonadota bacterium]